MGLRTELDRNERKQAQQNCEEIIRNFRDDPNIANAKKNEGLFAMAEEEAKKQTGAKEEEKKGGAAHQFVLTDSDDMSDDDVLNMSEFMREGGLQDEVERQKEAQRKQKQAEEEKKGLGTNQKAVDEAAEDAVDS